MLCQIWRFQLRNTLKLSHNKKFLSINPHHYSLKLSLFLFHFLLFVTFLCASKRSPTKKKWFLDKTGAGNVVLDLAILAQKYPKIVSKKNTKKKFKEPWVFFFFKIMLFLHCFDIEYETKHIPLPPPLPSTKILTLKAVSKNIFKVFFVC